MKEKEIKNLQKLYQRYNDLQRKAETALGVLGNELSKVTGKEIILNEFPGDGLGVQIEGNRHNSYMSFESALDLIQEKGTIDEDDKTYF